MAVQRVFIKQIRTAKQRAEDRAIRAKFQREKPSLNELSASGDLSELMQLGEFQSLRIAVHELKRLRETADLSLGDLSKLTGITKAALSRLENGRNLNPTLNTLQRYAAAVGRQVQLAIAEPVKPPRKNARRKTAPT